MTSSRGSDAKGSPGGRVLLGEVRIRGEIPEGHPQQRLRWAEFQGDAATVTAVVGGSVAYRAGGVGTSTSIEEFLREWRPLDY